MLSQMSSDDEARVEGSGDPPPNKKQKKEKREDRNRGNRMSVQARIAQFPKEFFQMGEEMWCKSCQICVDYKQMCTAKNHLSSKMHVRNKSCSLCLAPPFVMQCMVANGMYREGVASVFPNCSEVPNSFFPKN